MPRQQSVLLSSLNRSIFLRVLLIGAVLLPLLSCGGGKVSHTDPTVIFIGASTVQYWSQYHDFASRNWIDKGIAGNSCADVRKRFSRDVLRDSSHGVFILCGSNDMHPGYDPITTINDITWMVEQAQAANMSVHVASISPWGIGYLSSEAYVDYPARPADVDALNVLLEEELASRSVPFIDFRKVLKGPDSRFIVGLTDDGVHPNRAGYALMTPIAEAQVK